MSCPHTLQILMGPDPKATEHAYNTMLKHQQEQQQKRKQQLLQQQQEEEEEEAKDEAAVARARGSSKLNKAMAESDASSVSISSVSSSKPTTTRVVSSLRASLRRAQEEYRRW